MHLEENVPLSTLTTFRTGGPARFLITCEAAEELPEAVRFAEEKKLPLVPLGGGSNMLAPDEGVDAVFVRLSTNTVVREDAGDAFIYTADAGVSWDELVARAAADGAWGIENLSGIPGSVGAAAVQNIGAYGAAFSDAVSSVETYDRQSGAKKTFAPEACAFGYRTSIFKESHDRYFITRVSLRLQKTPASNLSYRDLARRFAEKPTPSLKEIRDAVLAIRAEKFPPLGEYGCAGSFFLNPVITPELVPALRARYPEVPLFDLPEGGVKVPLAWFLDRVLSLKGMREGDAFVWDKQPLVITATFGAHAKDVRTLATTVARMMKEKTGIAIAPEVRTFIPLPE